MHQEALQCRCEPIGGCGGDEWRLRGVGQGVGNSRCVQGTGLDSGLWSTVVGEVVKSLDSEVTLLFFGITQIDLLAFSYVLRLIQNNKNDPVQRRRQRSRPLSEPNPVHTADPTWGEIPPSREQQGKIQRQRQILENISPCLQYTHTHTHRPLDVQTSPDWDLTRVLFGLKFPKNS